MSSIDCRSVLLLAAALLAAPACGGSQRGGQISNSGMSPPESRAAGRPGEDAPPRTEPVQDQEDEFQVEGTQGVLEANEVQDGLRPHQAALQDCYQSQLKKRHFVAGDLMLQVRVDRTGQVAAATVAESDVGDWTVERCLLRVARRMTFTPPHGGDGQATFGVPLHFASDRTAAEAWPEERIAVRVAAKEAELDVCAGAGGAAAPGEVAVTLYVGNRGRVKAVGFSSSDVRPMADDWADCAAGKVGAWTFEDPRGKIVKTRFHYRPRTP